jgi:hypothetical protein
MQQASNLELILGARITGLPTANAAGQPVEFAQFNAAIEGIAWKDNARVSTSSNINLAAPGATLDGVTMALNDRFVPRGQTTTAENGIYVWNGAAVPASRAPDASTFEELESAVITIDEGTSAGVTYRQTAVNGVIGTNAVTWSTFGTSAPPASESTAGIAEIATQSEFDTGTDDARIVTPLKLANWAGRSRVLGATFGDGTATQFDFTHNFGTRNVTVTVYRNGTPWDRILCDDSRPDVNTARVNFAGAPASNQFIAVVGKN